MPEDRIAKIGCDLDANRRYEGFRRLQRAIHDHAEPELSPAEWGAAIAQIHTDPSETARLYLWRMIIEAGPRPELMNFALERLEERSDPHRCWALMYLRRNYLAIRKLLFDKFRNDSDADVRFQAALCIFDEDRSLAVSMIAGAIRNISHAFFTEAETLIVDSGNASHVEELRLNDQLAGGGTVFGEVAGFLEAQLSANERSPATG